MPPSQTPKTAIRSTPRRGAAQLIVIARALRPHQWVKNILVFLPLLMAHQVSETGLLLDAFVAFAAFSLLASGTYIVNDLVDREYDRQHPTKRTRPFASGALSPAFGYMLSPLLIASAFAISLVALPMPFSMVLAVYLIVTLAYSFGLKRWTALDVVILGGLYALRVLAGAAATHVELSEWLLAFSLFFFLSLAILKRYAELRLMQETEVTASKGRGYSVEDVAMLRGLGPATGFMAVLVLALYITSPEVTALYQHPVRLWLVTPLLLYWTMHMWLVAHRRAMPDDPVLFTVRDPISWSVGALAAGIVLAASL
ncbi:MAG: UbiA family prenyltransferase [Bacteroidetes bacterium]|nr:UbiA family prenyltransferase [Bacteroidota bacterium]